VRKRLATKVLELAKAKKKLRQNERKEKRQRAKVTPPNKKRGPKPKEYSALGDRQRRRRDQAIRAVLKENKVKAEELVKILGVSVDYNGSKYGIALPPRQKIIASSPNHSNICA
jgi:hypothetical protein